MKLENWIRSFPDFPKAGVLFRDISPLLRDPKAFDFVISHFAERYKNVGVDLVAGIEARGFIFASNLARSLSKGFIPVRKAGKLPGKTMAEDYGIEYGRATMEIQMDAIREGDKVLIVDDLLATGGTAKACASLIRRLGGKVAGMAFVIELVDLKGRSLLKEYDVYSMVKYG